MKKKLTLLIVLMIILSSTAIAQTTIEPYIIIPEEYRSWNEKKTSKDLDRTDVSENGMVAFSKYEASLVGLRVLQDGGYAVDAAVAMGFALGVCEPFTSGLGGGGFMTIYLAETDESIFLDFREVAPAASSITQYFDKKGRFIKGSSSVGGLAVGVPGETAGLLYALENYGTKSREQVIRPAAQMAQQGWISTPYYNTSVGWGRDLMVSKNGKANDLGEIFLNSKARPPQIGTVVSNPGLARALNLIIEHGKDGFYTGEIAQAVVNSVQEKGGVMTLEDLASYQVHVQEPVRGTYKGYEIMSASLPSSGGIGFLQIMNIMENFEVHEKDSAEQIHLFSEINKMVYADRSAYITDSEISDVPKKGLTSKEYAAMLADKIDMRFSQKYTYDDPWVYEGDNTNGSVAVDSMGNMVALTKTLNYYWGSGVVVKDFGIVLNNQLDDFSFEENSVNVIQPGKTPLSSLAPTVISKEGKPAILLSAPGGSKFFSIFAQLFSNVVDYGMTAEEAIQANRFIDMGESLDYSAPNLSKDTVKKLEALGHHLSNKNGSRFALPVMIAVDENGVKNGSTEFVDEGIFLDGCALGY